MRLSKYFLFVGALAMMIPVGAAARSKNKHQVTVADKVQVGSQQLTPGTYEVQWQGNGPAVQVEFLKNGKTVATTQGKWVQEANAAPHDSVIVDHNKLVEIDFHNQKQALQITNTNPSGE